MFPAVLYQTVSSYFLLYWPSINSGVQLLISAICRKLYVDWATFLRQPAQPSYSHRSMTVSLTELGVKPQDGVENVLEVTNTGVAYSNRIGICSFWPV